MVEFDGVISDYIRIRTMKRRDRIAGYLLSGVFCMGVIFTTITYYTNDTNSFKKFLIPTVILAFLSIYSLIAPQFPNSRFFKKVKWNVNVKISTDNIEYSPPVCIEPTIIPLEKIKKVIDEGDCYHIIYAEYSNSIICQKDLLVQGTLEEFEEIFKDKLVRKIKVKSDKTK